MVPDTILLPKFPGYLWAFAKFPGDFRDFSKFPGDLRDFAKFPGCSRIVGWGCPHAQARIFVPLQVAEHFF